MNATIRDVAEAAGVSISSVHIALSGKKGVSESTRALIKEVAERLGYQPNENAASLKRKRQKILIVLPGVQGDNSFFYPPMWQGIHDYVSAHIANAEFIEIPYHSHQHDEIAQKVHKMLHTGEIDGYLSAGHLEVVSESDWEFIDSRRIPVVFLNSYRENTDYLCCVECNYEVIGRTMAELITSRIMSYGSIFLLAGNPKFHSHSQIVRGFDAYLNENNIKNLVYKDFSWSIENANYLHILREVMRPDIAACASVFSQGTYLLGQALEESGKVDIFSVGSDLSEDTQERVRKGVFNNVIQKNPYAQGYYGIRVLTDYLVNGKEPESKIVYVGADVVFKSNLPMYEKSNVGAMIFY